MRSVILTTIVFLLGLVVFVIVISLRDQGRWSPTRHVSSDANEEVSVPVAAGPLTVSVALAGVNQAVSTEMPSPNHVVVRSTLQKGTGGFAFGVRLSGVAGRTITLDLEGFPFVRWNDSMPKYVANAAADRLMAFQDPSVASGASTRFTKGTEAATWGEGEQDWRPFDRGGWFTDRVTVVRKFARDEDVVYVAYRMPYPPTVVEAKAEAAVATGRAKVIALGLSAEGRPLTTLYVSSGPSNRLAAKPTVLVYAREHPDEQDGSWVVDGMLAHLCSDEGETALDACDYLLIPVLDPDGAARGVHQNILMDFGEDAEIDSPEAIAYTRWIIRELGNGVKIPIVIPLHNPPPGSAFHVACPEMPVEPTRLKLATEIHQFLRERLMTDDFLVRKTPWRLGSQPRRFSGWISRHERCIVLPYEMNSLTPKRILTPDGLRRLGARFADALSEYVVVHAAEIDTTLSSAGDDVPPATQPSNADSD